jgi:hypothetical protein
MPTDVLCTSKADNGESVPFMVVFWGRFLQLIFFAKDGVCPVTQTNTILIYVPPFILLQSTQYTTKGHKMEDSLKQLFVYLLWRLETWECILWWALQR